MHSILPSSFPLKLLSLPCTLSSLPQSPQNYLNFHALHPPSNIALLLSLVKPSIIHANHTNFTPSLLHNSFHFLALHPSPKPTVYPSFIRVCSLDSHVSHSMNEILYHPRCFFVFLLFVYTVQCTLYSTYIMYVLYCSLSIWLFP